MEPGVTMAHGSDLGVQFAFGQRRPLPQIVAFKRVLSTGIGGSSPTECRSGKDHHQLSPWGRSPAGK